MAKFDYRLVEKKSKWTAEITRKVSARKTTVTKSKANFATEKEANDWAQAELTTLSEQVSKRRRALKKSKEQAAAEKMALEKANAEQAELENGLPEKESKKDLDSDSPTEPQASDND